MQFDLKNMATFGVAGNFTGHLEQAGEARDFVAVKVTDAKAPKAIFPTYIPEHGGPAFLNVFPFDEDKIIFPVGEEKLQIEPECAIVCQAEWGEVNQNGAVVNGSSEGNPNGAAVNGGSEVNQSCAAVNSGSEVNQNSTAVNSGTAGNRRLLRLTPVAFGASNDCSIRKEGAKKISEKKNWGVASKGFSSHLLPIDTFSASGILNRYRIASFLVRDGQVHPYGEDSAVRDYSYVYEKLLEWMLDKFNNQQNEGPAEHIIDYLNQCGCPKQIMVSIGATRYTDFGEHNFLQNGDRSVVVLYPEDKYTAEKIAAKVGAGSVQEEDISILDQTVQL